MSQTKAVLLLILGVNLLVFSQIAWHQIKPHDEMCSEVCQQYLNDYPVGTPGLSDREINDIIREVGQ